MIATLVFNDLVSEESFTKKLVSFYNLFSWMTKLYSETCQTSKMEIFPKLVNDLRFQPLTIFERFFNLDVWQGSEYTYGLKESGPRKLVSSGTSLIRKKV